MAGLFRKTFFAGLVLLLAFLVAADEPPAYLRANDQAQAHANNPAGWTVNDLKTVTGPGDGNTWRNAGAEVLVRAFTNPQYYNLTTKKNQNLFPSALWVTTGDELPNWYQDPANGVNASNISLKTAELHGLPTSSLSQYNAIVEIWVDPAKVVRPTRDPNIQAQPTKLPDEAGFAAKPAYMSNADYAAYKTWYEANITSSYGDPDPNKRYPWTQLGYTYDWGSGNDDLASIRGLSEFVVLGTKAGVTSALETYAVYSIQSYLYQYGGFSTGNFNITGSCDTVWAGTNFQLAGNQITIGTNGSVQGGEGIYVYSNGYTVTNNGTISGPTSGKYYDASLAGTSVYFRDGGTFVNNASGSMYGDSIAIGGSATTANPINITNYGYITADQSAISTGSGDDSLSIENGGVVRGDVNMGAGNDTVRIKNGGQFTSIIDKSAKTASTINSETITLDNGSILGLELNGSGLLQAGDSMLIANGTVINGNFTSIPEISPLLYFSTSVTGGNTLMLTVGRNSYSSVAGNQDSRLRGIGSALDVIVSNPSADMESILSSIDSLSSSASVADAVRQLTPMVHSSAPQVSFENSRMVFQQLSERSLTLAGEDTTNPPELLGGDGASGGVDRLPLKETEKNWRGYTIGSGSWGTQKSRDNVAGYNYNSWSAIVGAENKLCKDLLLGIAIAGGTTNIGIKDDGGSRSSIDSIRPITYTGLSLGNFHSELGAGYGYNQYDTKRKIVFGDVNRTAKSEHDGHEISGMLNAGYKFFLTDKLVLDPMAGLYASMLHETPFDEHDAGDADLKVSSRNSYSLKSQLGPRITYTFDVLENLQLKPEVTVRWLHEFLDNSYDSNASFRSGGPSFTYRGMDYDRDAFEFKPKLSCQLYKHVSIFAEYSLLASPNNVSHGVNLGLEATFNLEDILEYF
ncbi:MAG: hypothetical protein A2X49_07785 [Lentisphaerae bacterium GWF2_52_8]|nr:MAG: hypothetical protein A2X49_07785 [Lentisphaerae bacterium GWF2_52_8]